MSTELEMLRNKADRLSAIRKELYALDEAHNAITANLRNEADALKMELLEEFAQLDLKSFKSSDGTGYAVTPTKSIAFDAVAEAQVLQWASQYNAVSLDKNKIKDLIKRGVELPSYIRVQTTNTIRITNPKVQYELTSLWRSSQD